MMAPRNRSPMRRVLALLSARMWCTWRKLCRCCSHLLQRYWATAEMGGWCSAIHRGASARTG